MSSLRLLAVLTFLVVGSACSGYSGVATISSATTATTSAPTRIILADLLDQRGTVVTLGSRTPVRSVMLPGRSPGDPPVDLAATGGDLVFYGRDGTYAMPASLAAPSRRLHRGLYFILPATPGRVWIAIQDPHHPDQRLVSHVVEVTTAGRTITSSSHRPPTRNIIGAVLAGLVVQKRAGLAVWDPRTGATLRTLPGSFVAATHGNLIAWCGHGCPVMHVTDAASGRDHVIPHIGHRAWEETYRGAISPDGRYLALPIHVGHGQQVALVDLRSTTSRLIPGSHLDTNYGSIAWDPAVDTVYFTAGGGRIMRYQIGHATAIALPVHLHGQFTNMAIIR